MTEIAEHEQLQESDGEDGRPAGLPENFKTVEALAESYKELNRTYTQTSQELSETRQSLDAVLEATQQFEPVYEPPPLPVALASRPHVDQLEMLARLANEAAANAVRRLKPVGSFDPAALAHQSAVDELIARDPELRAEWPQLAPLVAARVEQNPALLTDQALESPQATVQALKQIARGVRVEQVHQLANLNQQLSEQSTLAMKLRAQVTTGSGGRPLDVGDSDEEFAASLIAAHTGTYAQQMQARGL